MFLTTGNNYILVQTSCPDDRSFRTYKEVILFDIAAINSQLPERLSSSQPLTTTNLSTPVSSTPSTEHRQELEFVTLPENLASEINIPLGILSRDRLVFLDRNFWVCSWYLPLPSNLYFRRTGETAEIKRHYFLPGDWISPDCVELFTATSEGTVLCPGKEEAAVVKCAALKNNWFDHFIG